MSPLLWQFFQLVLGAAFLATYALGVCALLFMFTQGHAWDAIGMSFLLIVDLLSRTRFGS